MAAKQDDFAPHPIKEQLPGVDFCLASSPPWPQAILLAFQHYLVMLGTSVFIPSLLVPQMGGGYEEKARVIQTLLFVAGINTLLQSYLGTRLPAVIGGSFTYILPTISIILSPRFAYIPDPYLRFEATMRAIQGALIAASSLQIVLGFCGIWRIFMRFLSPLAAVPIVTITALGLFYYGFPIVASCIEVGLPAIILLVFFSQYVAHYFEKRRMIFDRFAVLVTVVIVWVYAHILTVAGAYKHRPPKTQFSCRTDRAGLIGGSPWIKIPYPFQWGGPTFDAGEAFAMMAASFASLIESTGTLIAVSRYASATPVPPSIFSRGVGWQGIAILLSGMFGTANGSAASVENAGLQGLTRVGSRRVIQISALFMIFFSILGKFGALFASIPFPIIAALYCVLYAYTASAGLGFLQFCNLNSMRTKFILGFSLFMGLSVAQYFREYEIIAGYGPLRTHARWFNDIVNVIFGSAATVAAIVAYFLDCTMLRGDSATRRDRGWHWWEKFRSYKTDPRSEEFYALPYNLGKFFPSL
ncbi:nucleobase-ascorbate transporter 6-like [Dioscorea cayenensis subsp. rotundata]|uniref:Nucleobase-ascorbate transporter 6-like n=1 Tax=Dioscorea cayennensis subsp. rotundata TaxID=55577 RepID=A0AB40AGB4_DIOCR|nr:nucleobase-ascorbate transporter 6-like [Dioscorea cayenensis subsp. rotundata]